jgi:hypothetical protein
LPVFQGASEAPISESYGSRALPTAHFERNDVTIICETVH